MSKRVQIVVLREEAGGRQRWRMVAHGAPYDRKEGESYVTQYGKARVRLLPVPADKRSKSQA